MADFQIKLNIQGDIAVFNWEGSITAEALTRAVSAASDDALLLREMRRLEVSLPEDDLAARGAVLQAGFRQEGIRRQAWTRPDGSYGDVILFARLAADQVHGPNARSGVMNSVLPKTRVMAHVLIRDEAGRILLCQTPYASERELPGGVAETGESPRVTAAREVREELGINVQIGPLLALDWLPPSLGWDDAVEFIFDGGVVTAEQIAAMVLQPGEIVAASFCTVAEAADSLNAGSLRRLTHALSAQHPIYLEDGRSPA